MEALIVIMVAFITEIEKIKEDRLINYILSEPAKKVIEYNLKPENKLWKIEVVIENLTVPWAIDFLPDGTMVITQRNWTVNLFKNGSLFIIWSIQVFNWWEWGLLGVAVDPNFNSNRFIYLYYTGEKSNIVSRFELNGAKLTDEKILVNGITKWKFHNGGRIKIWPDGLLYITTGDALVPELSQDKESLAWKILRVNLDGTIPKENPFGSLVYSMWHRNPQWLTWDKSWRLFSSEHGPSMNDEINIITKWWNYGWPNAQCTKKSKEYISPIKCFDKFTLAPSWIAFHKNILYVTWLRWSQLRKITLNGDLSIKNEEVVIDNYWRIRDVVMYWNYLYIATSNRDWRWSPQESDDKIIRMKIK